MTQERYYVQKDGKRMRCGYTTGSCAAAAVKAAALMLFTGKRVETVWLMTPKGMDFTIPVEDIQLEKEFVRCAVRKDAGDDSDITNGILLYAQVSRYPAPVPEVKIDGGTGIGRVTLPGLNQPVGNAAINSIPRHMITQEILSICEDCGYLGGVQIILSIPNGEELAKKTFNPRLGIVGGLSVLGTTGVVEPMSDAAVVETVRAELSMLRAAGRKYALITPGNYGEQYLTRLCEKDAFVAEENVVKVSNFIGDSLDIAMEMGFERVLLAGHIGKLIKLAGGLMNTHSRYGDCRAEIIASHAALNGANQKTVQKIMESATTESMLDILEQEGLKEPVMQSILERISFYVNARVQSSINVEILLFSNQHGFLVATEGAEELVGRMGEEAVENLQGEKA